MHSSHLSPGHVSDGAVVSFTVMICMQGADVFPQAFRADHTRWIVLTTLYAQFPGTTVSTYEVVIADDPHVSIAVGKPVFAGPVDCPHSTIRSPGQVNVGGTVLFTVITCVQPTVFPQSSIAVQRRLIVAITWFTQFPGTTVSR